MGLDGWGIYDYGWGIYDLNGWGIYGSNGWGSYLFQEMLKNTGLQGSTLSGPCMTTGFGLFELLTHGLLQKGRDHSPPKFLLCEEPSFLVDTAIARGIHSYEYSNR